MLCNRKYNYCLVKQTQEMLLYDFGSRRKPSRQCDMGYIRYEICLLKTLILISSPVPIPMRRVSHHYVFSWSLFWECNIYEYNTKNIFSLKIYFVSHHYENGLCLCLHYAASWIVGSGKGDRKPRGKHGCVLCRHQGCRRVHLLGKSHTSWFGVNGSLHPSSNQSYTVRGGRETILLV